MTGWATSAHALSNASLLTATTDTWANLINPTTVADAACGSCHRPHSAGGHQRLLRHEPEENNCLSCHDAHGVESQAHLINFDRTIVDRDAAGNGPDFQDLGFRTGTCTLTCHNVNHTETRYPN